MKICPYCSHQNAAEARQCLYCRHPLNGQPSEFISWRGIVLSIGVVGILILSMAPVWPAGRIFGKAINLLGDWGVSPLSFSIHEPGQFHEMIGWVLNIYQGLHAIHFVAILAMIGLLVVNWFTSRQLTPGSQRKAWLLLGILLLLFPAANLLISWRLFLMPGVLGTAIASLLVMAVGVFK
jgi:hypothetical protein